MQIFCQMYVHCKSLLELNFHSPDGADVNMADNHGASALHLASEEGSTDCVRLLLKAKANVNAKKRNGDTPIMLAAQRGQDKVVW